MHNKKVMPTLWLLITVGLMIVLHFVFPLVKWIPLPWNLLGLIPLLAGIILNIQADKRFHQANTTVKPFEESNALVTDGVYRMTRNPMYLGFILVLCGIAILLGSVSPLFIIPFFAGLVQIVYIEVEETMLEEKFGDAWLDFKSRTGRWF
jgi:protein-S-isoprenylcysteine O-methyltransferase Ste14